jgi:PQQ-dependent catabolism-associated CXXCW motif protein
MKSSTTRNFFTHMIAMIPVLAIVSTASAAQDSFGKPKTTPPPESSTGRTVAAPGNAPSRNAPPRNPAGASNDMKSSLEREDFGVAPTRALHSGTMHAPTPVSIPGGQVITTTGLLDLQRRQIPHVLFDVLGGPDMLPNAIPAAWLSEPGSFNDEVQKRGTAMLMQATQGRKDVPLVFYCQGTHCWMSYNAALRAINAGFTNVLWYRGGIEAWTRNAQQ